MKRIDLPLSQLTLPKKLNLMETIWADLTRDEAKLESPAWHEAILKDREEAFKVWRVTVSDWEESKERIRKKVS